MTDVLVERHAVEPLTDADILQMVEDARNCRTIHRVERHRSLLSTDGRELVCHLSSPDLESIRIGLRAQRPLAAELWSCTLRDAPDLTPDELAQSNVLASWRFEAPVTLEELESIDGSGTLCRSNHRVRFLRTFVALDRRRVLCLCRAADAESVRLALREAKWPVERVWAFRQFVP